MRAVFIRAPYVVRAGQDVEVLAAFDEKWDLAYERREAWLLQTFRTFPGLAVPKVGSAR